MTIKVTLKDGTGTNGEAAVIKRSGLPSGIVTYTEPYISFVSHTEAFTNDTYGSDMNFNHAFSGTPEYIHNGTDNVYWTATALSGSWTFDSITQAYAGTKSISAIATVNNNEAQLADGGTTNTGGYVAVTGAIYIAAWPTGGGGVRDVGLRLRLSGVNVGVEVLLSSFIDTTTIGAWQTFNIPISNFNTSGATIDQMVIRTIHTGGGSPQDYYLDALQFEQAGSSIYRVEPNPGTVYKITTVQITMVDAFDSTLANSSVPKVAYNQFIGVSALTNGLAFKLTIGGIVRFDGSFRRHLDIMTYPGVQLQVHGDGTNTTHVYTIPFDPPIILDSRDRDDILLTLADNLTGLLFFRIYTNGGIVDIIDL